MSDYHAALVWQSSCAHRGHKAITPLQRCILSTFAKEYDIESPEIPVNPSQEYLAWLFEVSRETVNRSIAGLVKAGYIRVVRPGQGLNNLYYLIPETLTQDVRSSREGVTDVY